MGFLAPFEQFLLVRTVCTRPKARKLCGPLATYDVN